jgi:Sulfotransferase family
LSGQESVSIQDEENLSAIAESPFSFFDEDWYLKKYPDVRESIEHGAISCGAEHFQRVGNQEGRISKYKTLSRRIIHLHIPKTAGTLLRNSLIESGLKVLSVGPHFHYVEENRREIAVFSGHIGYNIASKIKGDLITIFRDPIQRFISYYFHLIQSHDTGYEVSHRTKLAKKYSLSEFVNFIDDPEVCADLYNAITWQMAYGNIWEARMELREVCNMSDDKLLRMAIDNAKQFALIGFQSDMKKFLSDMKKLYGIKIYNRPENVTLEKIAQDVDVRTRRKIYNWIYLDIEFFLWATTHFADDTAQSPDAAEG